MTKICIPIIGPTSPEVHRQVAVAATLGDWVELRLDKWDSVDENVIDHIRQHYPQLPMIFTLRKPSQGGNFKGTEEERISFIASLLRLKPEYVDIEADVPLSVIQQLQSLSPETKLIVSWHDFDSTPDLDAVYERISQIPADYYKIATMALSICDSLRMLQLAQKINSEKPILCAICMGENGECTRILSPIFNNPFTFAALDQGQETAPGQLSAKTLLETYHIRSLNPMTHVLGLIGDPVSKSVGHLTHNAVFEQMGVNAVYVKFRVTSEQLDDFFQLIPTLNLKGLSVTMPHKERVLKYLPVSIDACNTIRYENGSWNGCNTDGKGAIKALGLSNLEGKKMIILGAGGSAKAIAQEAKKHGADLRILNRTLAKGLAIANSLQASAGTLEDLTPCDILIQTTPVGMSPLVNDMPIDCHSIHTDTLVMDIISNPRETRFLRECRLKGCPVIGGIEMFIHQAVEQFTYWFGDAIDQKKVEAIIRNVISSKKPILQGRLTLPSSKSHSIRAVLLGAMAQGTSRVKKVLDSPDIHDAIRAARQLGAIITQEGDQIVIDGVGGMPQAPDDVIQVGNSGQVLRFVGALAALSPHYTVLTGDHSIRSNRPVQPLLDGLKGLGVFAESTRQNGKAPIIVKGPLQPGETFLTGEDSQPVSGLLMAAAFVEGKTIIHVQNPGETPWIGLTLSWLDRLGVQYTNQNFEKYTVHGKRQHSGFDYIVPGDFSSAAFPIVAALITGSEIAIDNVDMTDVQGDKAIIPVLQEMGAQIDIDSANRCLYIKKSPRLVGRTIDLNPIIDAVTILAVLGCFAEGETRLINGSIARQKECNRLACIAQELSKMGAKIQETDDGLIIRQSTLKGSIVKSHHDHRMALSLLVASLGADGVTEVEGLECIQKSYPTFIKDMQMLGAHFK